MPTSYTDQFYTFDPAAPPPAGTAVTFTTLTLVDQNDDGDVDRFNGDSVNGSDVQRSYPGDTVTINVPGMGDVIYTGITFYLANGQRVFTPTDGKVLENGTFVSSTFVSGQGPLDPDDLGPACYTPGAGIATPQGSRAIEDLEVGDLVCTRDHGNQPLIWIGKRTVSGLGAFAPVRIDAGVVENRKPLLVSPQHRLLVRGWRAELFCGQDEVLVAARHLVDGDRVVFAPCESVTYIHIACENHEIIRVDGAKSETFDFNGDFAQSDPEIGREMRRLFPEIAGMKHTARPSLKAFEARAVLG